MTSSSLSSFATPEQPPHSRTVETNANADAVADALIEPAIELVDTWMRRADELETREDRATMTQLGDLVSDDAGVAFVMAFVDRVARPEHHGQAARQLRSLVRERPLPNFLSSIDKALLHTGAQIAPVLPRVVMPIAIARMRSIVGHLVAPGEPAALARHLEAQRQGGYKANVNLLGEAVLGEEEADRRLARLKGLLAVPDVDYVSVKITAVASQINHWAHEESLERLTTRLADLVDTAAASSTPTFVNFDMEEFHDLYLTVEAFRAVLGEEHRLGIDAGIVIQAYLPESRAVLEQLTHWANDRFERGGGTIKIRLVKGANLAMEQVEAAIHGWEQAPFSSKIESDASYRNCLDWVLQPEHLTGTRIGVASHNLFDVAWAKLVAESRGVLHRVQFEMLQGMATSQAKAVNEDAQKYGSNTLLYTPAVAPADFDVAVGYLFRRLEENATPENYLRKVFDLKPGTAAFADEAEFFRAGTMMRHDLDHSARRDQNRSQPAPPIDRAGPFHNEPDTDPSVPTNRAWIDSVRAHAFEPCQTEMTTSVEEVDAAFQRSKAAQLEWSARPATERRSILHDVADLLSQRRGQLMSVMMHEANKTIDQADVELSEAIDFARWYGDRSLDLDLVHGATFQPFGVVAVIPPWNFPVAIPAGGVFASLAAGNGVILKPAPQVPRCAELVAAACWDAGVPRDLLTFIRTPDDDTGRSVVEGADAVILTGSSETAELFQSWKPDLRLFAETSGKNALIITASADIDLAVHDLVASAFGHGGQKCSAASLAVLVGEAATSQRFRRQLVDAVQSLTVGSAHDPSTDLAPLVDGGNERLDRAVGTLDVGETWLVKPTRTDDGCITPGVRDGVRVGSWFHSTECFGPVVGLMYAADLGEAIAIVNSSDFGLTGGIHSLDPAEIRQWADEVEVGNGYVNRPITGAIVQRQPFGGWKRSAVGPGAKAGGPNYLRQLGTWTPVATDDDFAEQWAEEFSVSHDPTGLFCEANLFRYRPLNGIGVVSGNDTSSTDRTLIDKASRIAGVPLVHGPSTSPDRATWFADLARQGIERVRFVGCSPGFVDYESASRRGIHIITGPVTASGALELSHLVREQAMSVTLHRFGNLVNSQELALVTD